MEYVKEYLLIFSEEIKLSQNKEHLKSIIQGNENLIFKEGDIVSYNEEHYNLIISKIESSNHKCRSYVIKVLSPDIEKDDDDKKLKFIDFNKELIDTIKEIKHSQLNTLRDDVSLDFSVDGYRHINQIENKMRKLITLFMTAKVGLDWVAENTPQDVINSIRNEEAKKADLQFNNFLSETDFIQLSNFLFERYNTLKTNDLQRILMSNDAIDLEYIKGFIPKSNWERYFSSIIDTKEAQIIKWWEMLYTLRNVIAHNRFISYEDYRRLLSLKNNMNTVIDEAINNIEAINVTGSQQEEIKSEVIREINPVKKEVVNEVSKKDVVKDTVISDSGSTLRRLNNLIYSNIEDSFKSELRKSRSKLKYSVSRYNSDPSELNKNLLSLETKRSLSYLSEIANFINV
ncbi:hypothetical protein KXR87_16480 [Yokenella regensburgei]|uniref:hypothetical protein n=1 Tax=Yokenella regensburgei TaxID=158877 RepID=UPI003F188A3D